MDISKNRNIVIRHLGLISYAKAWNYQDDLLKSIVEIKNQNRDENKNIITPNYILTCEHPHVYTIGKSGKINHLLIGKDELEKNGAEFFETNRGGDITYHGPGQLVVYPILDLENFFTDIHLYLRCLEEAVILTLAKYSISAGRVEGLTGVWVDHQSVNPRKICAMGVRTSRWVTMHGLALNVNTDMNYFTNIVACGIADKAVTSLRLELNKDEINLVEVGQILIDNILKVMTSEAIKKVK